MKTLSQAFTAGQTIEYQIAGRHFRLIDCASPADVTFYDEDGIPSPEVALAVDTGFWTNPAGGFTKVVIKSSAAQTIKFGIASRESGYDKLFGQAVVTNIEPGVIRADAGGEFSMAFQAQCAVAQYCGLVLWNGGALTLKVRRAFVSIATTAHEMWIAMISASYGGAVTQRFNKKGGGPNSTATFLQAGSLGAPPTLVTNQVMWRGYMNVNDPRIIEMGESPFILPPNYGLAITNPAAATAALAVSGGFQWWES